MDPNTENMSSYNLVLSEEDQQPVIENDKILLWNSTNNSCEYVALTPIIKRHFNLVDADPLEAQENTVFENPEESPLGDQEKFTWTNQSTLLMLDAYKTRFFKFRDPKNKKKTLWDEIALEMRKKGYFVDADLLDRKMRNMKNTYRTILDNNNKKKSTGRGRIQWEYYNNFVDIFQEDKTVNLPKSILSSTKIDSKMSAELEEKASRSNNIVSTPLSSPYTSTVRQLSGSEDTPPNPAASYQKPAQASRLDRFRKRQLEVEEEKLKELKKIRESIEESNRLQNEKNNLFKQCFLPKETE